jgi:hypothetical protein
LYSNPKFPFNFFEIVIVIRIGNLRQWIDNFISNPVVFGTTVNHHSHYGLNVEGIFNALNKTEPNPFSLNVLRLK